MFIGHCHFSIGKIKKINTMKMIRLFELVFKYFGLALMEINFLCQKWEVFRIFFFYLNHNFRYFSPFLYDDRIPSFLQSFFIKVNNHFFKMNILTKNLILKKNILAQPAHELERKYFPYRR